MQNNNFKKIKLSLPLIVWTIIIIYCFIAFIPIPKGIETGIDPSWKYAISHAAVDKLIFGQDIIFTYGPLGYLIDGAALEQNLFFLIASFRFAVYFTLFILASVKIVKLKTVLQKLALTLSLLFLMLMRISIDYQILFIFLIILSLFDRLSQKWIRWCALGLGAFAGFCLLTKFTLGIATASSLVLFFLGRFCSSIKVKSNRLTNSFALIDSLLAVVSVSFILLSPDYYVSNLNKVLICLALSGGVGVLTYCIQQFLSYRALIKVDRKVINSRELSSKFHIQTISWYVFYLTYCLCILITIVYSYPAWIDYLKSSIEIASGYSSAMSRVGYNKDLILAISEIVLISILLFLMARQGNIGFSLALFPGLFLAFKHGFVRQDVYHIVAFCWYTLIATLLSIPKLKAQRVQKFSYLLHLYVLIIAFILWRPLGDSIYRPFSPEIVAKNLSYMVNVNAFQSSVQASSNANLAIKKLPENILNIVKNKKIDIIPSEISLVPANNLSWKPRPVIQSYSAYTTFLDNQNFESLSTEPRDYIFYDFISEDNRHPFFDEPKTFFYVFCNYGVRFELLDFIKTRFEPSRSVLILEKLKSSLCSQSNSIIKTSTVRWNNSQLIEASDRSIILAKVKFTYSLFGKIYKSLFRSPPVMMQVTYADGSERDYRIIPENSENGVIVSHLPKDDNEALSFFRRQLPAQVQSFRFHATNSLLYSPTIEINFLSFDILKPSFK